MEMPPEPNRDTRAEIHIRGGQGTVIGDSNTVVQNFFQRAFPKKTFRRFQRQQFAGFLLIALLLIGSAVALYLALHFDAPEKMAGPFNIAVANFEGWKQLRPCAPAIASLGKEKKNEAGVGKV